MNTLKTGVELELWVVDHSGQLRSDHEIPDAHSRIEPEFIDPLVEVRTQPHAETRELRRDLQQTLRTAIRAADAEDKLLVPLGTPLTDSNASVNNERGELFEQIYGDGIKSAKNCAGTHIHFEQDNVVRQLNLLTALDPALALASSSPYYSGEAGVSSSRALAYRKTCGIAFQPYCDLWKYTDSLAEWQERVERVYEEFKGLALERGVNPERVEESFSPEDTVLNPVRLRESQPTVEWRAPDATLPSQILQLAADMEALIAQTSSKSIRFGTPEISTDYIQVPEFSDLRERSRQAIRSGLGNYEVRTYLRKMGFKLSEYQPRSQELKGPQKISESQARSMRLDQARRLRADVGTMTDEPSLPTAVSST